MDFQRIKALVIKEFLAVWQDKKTRSLLILPPILQLLIFAWAATLDVTNATIAFLNLDDGKWGVELFQRFEGAPTFAKIISLRSASQIPDIIDNQKALMVVHVDKNFSSNVIDGKEALVQLILDGRKSNTTQILQGYAASILTTFNEDMNAYYGRMEPKSELIVRNWFNPNLTYTWFTVTGLVVILTALITVAITSLSISREREMGTFEQLLVSPLLPIEIMIGKAFPAVIIATLEGTLIAFAAVTFFGIPFLTWSWLKETT